MALTDFTEEELRDAVIAYGTARCNAFPMPDPGHVFSARYEERKKRILALAKRQRIYRRALRHVASIIIVLLVFGTVVLVSSEEARAAVRNWVINTYNKVIEFRFEHNENDHAFIICAPGFMPDGFERVSQYRSSGHAVSVYENIQTGDSIRFEYNIATEALIAEAKRQSETAELLLKDGIIEKYCVKQGRFTRVVWYDPQRELVFFADSTLDRSVLEECLRSISFRLPLYEPTWLPEGYEKADLAFYYPLVDVLYINASGDLIMYGYTDLAETSVIGIEHLEVDTGMERLVINGMEAYYSPHDEEREGGDLIIIDEENKLVFMIEAGIEKDMITKLAESIICTETDW